MRRIHPLRRLALSSSSMNSGDRMWKFDSRTECLGAVCPSNDTSRTCVAHTSSAPLSLHNVCYDAKRVNFMLEMCVQCTYIYSIKVFERSRLFQLVISLAQLPCVCESRGRFIYVNLHILIVMNMLAR